MVTELKKDGETPAFKVRLSGRAYNKKTMKPQKSPNTMPQVIVLLMSVHKRAQVHRLLIFRFAEH